MMTLAQKLQACLHHNHRDFDVVDAVTIDLGEGVCSEEIGDELVLWLRRHGMRAKRLDRLRTDIVRFGFEAIEAAAKFRAAFDIRS